jgi:uncharacterized protein involved in exopolysaccharide biosynthesis
MGTVLCGVTIPLALRKATPTYETRGTVIVNPDGAPILSGQEIDRIPGDFGDYTRTVAARFSAFDLLEEALASIPQDRWPVFLNPALSDSDNVYKLMSRLKVRPVSRTFLIEVKLAAHHPESLAEILNAVMTALVRRVEAEQEDRFSHRLEYLEQERRKLEQRLVSMRREVIAMAANAGSKAFLHETYDSHLQKVGLLQRQYLEAERQRLDAKADVDHRRQLGKTMEAQSIKPLANTRIADDYGINRMELWTYEKLQELRASVDGLTDENLDRQYVVTRMENMQEYLHDYRENARQRTVTNLEDERRYHLDKSLLDAEARMDAAESRARQLKDTHAEAYTAANDISEVIYKASGTSSAIIHTEQRLAALTSRIHDTQLLARSPTPVTVDEQAQSPSAPAGSNISKLFLAGVLLSFCVAFGGCLAVDFVDQRIRIREDLEHCFGGPVAAVVPASMSSELPLELRRFATRLSSQCRHHGANVHLLCGVTKGAGTSTVSAKLADALRGQGENVALVDCTATDASAKQMLATISDAAKAGQMVLVDAPAVACSELALFLAQCADTVTLVVRADEARCDDTADAVKSMLAVRVPAIAAVLNFAGPEPGTWLCRTLLPKLLAGLSRSHRLTRKLISI